MKILPVGALLSNADEQTDIYEELIFPLSNFVEATKN
jgi:hypothetical protein